ncbi:phage tail protein [Cochlodiniinecator piscidefendens]|uniref:phage tail protein n=1 Tax=Cochlodiniinecator piscidefendens TaxID=2715756 RepID=UPI00140A828F
MFKVGETDISGLKRFENQFGALGNDGARVQVHALNRVGDMAKTRAVREIASQTGLTQKTVRNSVSSVKASEKNLEYQLRSSGADMSLKYFKARETQKGVTALVRGSRELFEGAFIKGGSFGTGRVELRLGGHVFQRMGDDRLEIEKVTSCVVIPLEMVKPETADAFNDLVVDVLPRGVSHEINRILKV